MYVSMMIINYKGVISRFSILKKFPNVATDKKLVDYKKFTGIT